MDIDEATRKLESFGVFGEFLGGKKMWSAMEIVEELGRSGIKVSDTTVKGWFADYEVLDLGKLGFFLSRTNVILMLARRIRDPKSGAQVG